MSKFKAEQPTLTTVVITKRYYYTSTQLEFKIYEDYGIELDIRRELLANGEKDNLLPRMAEMKMIYFRDHFQHLKVFGGANLLEFLDETKACCVEIFEEHFCKYYFC